MVNKDDHCESHQWWYEKGDYCPECKGAEDERERIIALLVNAIIDSEGYCHADTVIALIRGEDELDN